jgi:hypothetical protein
LKTEWKRVEDELPTEDGLYLVVFEYDEDIDRDRYIGVDSLIGGEFHDAAFTKVTHWQALPQLPKKSQVETFYQMDTED